MEPLVYEIEDEATYRNACKRLEAVPPEQWPGGPAVYNRVYIGVRLYQMEQSEKEQ